MIKWLLPILQIIAFEFKNDDQIETDIFQSQYDQCNLIYFMDADMNLINELKTIYKDELIR